jgi:hypothetical protein
MWGAVLSVAILGQLAGNAPAAAQVQKIWDRAPHNAFTDLVRFKGQWVCVFREGLGHAAGAGRIRILLSPDGKKWDSAALLEAEHVDLRDPHLSITPDGRLMLNGGVATPASRRPVKDHYSFVSFSKDGKEWTEPRRILDSWQWLWRVTWHKGTAYGIAYSWDPKIPEPAAKFRAALYKSPDGLRYEKVMDFALPNATEAALAFDGDRMYCLQRRDGKPNSAQLGTSLPPYKEWTWKDLGGYFGGPAFTKAPDGSWWAAGRQIDKGKPRTVLCRLHVAKGDLSPIVALPSGGDTSYPGMVWHDGELWFSYYSSHEGKTSIYLARYRPASP